MMGNRVGILYLCGGLQSSGSTLVSWCFLQRPDMDGVLDADNDILSPMSPELGRPYTWYKTTISCFRMSELIAHFDAEGWEVRPLLVVRDLRKVWASLSRKPYGLNGTTAEDPPLRIRLSRFKEDWNLFRSQGWPMLRYEDLVSDPEWTLRTVCDQLGLCWSEDMIRWPKSPDEIANTRHGNRTFRATRGQSLFSTLKPDVGELDADAVPAADMEWLETEFRGFNRSCGYPSELGIVGKNRHDRAVPKFEVTRRYKWDLRRKPMRWLLAGLENLHPVLEPADRQLIRPVQSSGRRKKFLGLVESPDHVCCRYRVRAFLPGLGSEGWQTELRTFPSGLLHLLVGARHSDAVLLQRRLLYAHQIALLRKYSARLIFDFDDAVLYRDSYSTKGPNSPRRTARFQRTVQLVDAVIAGNRFLAELAEQFVDSRRVFVVPTCVDPERYHPKSVPRTGGGAELVWIGSASTLRGLERVSPMLEAIGRSVPGVRLKVICDCFPDLRHLRIVPVKWSEPTEANEVAASDIGISWVPDDLWSRGKCGLKLLQYMAAGLPVIANPVGVHTEIIEHGTNGFLARTDDEWIDAIQTLAGDPELRFRMGVEGRRIVEQRYSVSVWAPVMESILRRGHVMPTEDRHALNAGTGLSA